MMNNLKKYQLAVSALFIAGLLYLLSKLEYKAVYKTLVGLDAVLVSLGVLSLIIGTLVKIERFGLVSRYYKHPITYMQSSLIQMVGISIAMFTPARVGEGSKAILLNKQAGVPITTSFGIVIFERFFDMIFLSMGAFWLSYNLLQGKITALLGLFILALLTLFIIFVRYFNRISMILPEKYKAYFSEVVIEKNLGLVLVIMALTGVTWALEAGLPWMIARSMGIEVSYPLVFGVVCISTITVVISVLPAGLGTMDMSFLVLFPLIGVSSEIALSILLIYRLIGIIIPLMFSFIIMNYYGMSFKEIKGQIED